MLDGVISTAQGSSGFTLSTDPAGGITVEVDGLAILPMNGPALVWSFDPLTRRVFFEPLYRPPPGSTVRVTYGSACN